MSVRFLFAALLVAGCAPDPEPSVRVTRWRDFVVETRSLPAETAFAAVGLRPAGERDDGATDWNAAFRESPPRLMGDRVRREFRLTIANRGTTALEFHARIDYRDEEGKLLRRRTLEDLIVPPFTETTWIGATILPPAEPAEVLARVLPASEPFDPEPAAP